MQHRSAYIAGSVVLAGVLVAGWIMYQPSSAPTLTEPSATLSLAGEIVDFYRSPTCGCCAGHAAALEAAGATVRMHEVSDVALQELKQSHQIPFAKQSCHTALIDGYVIEGHVPIPAIATFLAESPAGAGITLPGMPIGTPGMPGRQTEPFVVETLAGAEYWRQDPS